MEVGGDYESLQTCSLATKSRYELQVYFFLSLSTSGLISVSDKGRATISLPSTSTSSTNTVQPTPGRSVPVLGFIAVVKTFSFSMR